MIDGLLHSCSQKTAIAIACTETTTSSHKRTPVHQLFASSWVDCTLVTSHCAQGLLSLIIRQSLALSLRSPPASTSLIHPQFPCRVFPLQSPLAIVLFSPMSLFFGYYLSDKFLLDHQNPTLMEPTFQS